MEKLLGELQHQEHRDWLSKLNFYQDEIKIFQHELMRILMKHPKSLSIIEHVEEYQKIFLAKLEHIDKLRLKIILHEKELGESLTPSTENVWDHSEERLQINEFVNDFEAMKQNFRRFASRND